MESMYNGNLTESKSFEQSMPVTNQVPTESLGTKMYQQDHNSNNVSHCSGVKCCNFKLTDKVIAYSG